jgi:hypothetical protein
MKRWRPALAALFLFATAAALSSCGGPASLSSQIQAWSSEEGYPALDQALVADFPEVAAGLKSGQLKALKTACAGLQIDAGSVYSILVTPDRTLTNQMAASLTGLSNDAARCAALASDAPVATEALRRSLSSHEAAYDAARAFIAAHAGGE